MIEKIYQLKKLNVYKVAAALRNKCDPDVAAIAAWWVFHNKKPKKWSLQMETTNSKILNMKIHKEEIPQLSEHIFNLIMKNYKINKTTGTTNSLFPL